MITKIGIVRKGYAVDIYSEKKIRNSERMDFQECI